MTPFKLFTLILLLFVIHITDAKFINVLPPPTPGKLKAVVREFAKIPDYHREAARIVGITSWKSSLYVCTSTSGGRIYRVFPNGSVSLWFDVQKALNRRGRTVELYEKFHGGIRSIAFHTAFSSNKRFYVSLLEGRGHNKRFNNYLSKPSYNPANADSVVLEFKVKSIHSLEPDPSTMREVLRIGIPFFDHPIKQMVFRGPYLYIGHGDGSVQSAYAGGGQANDALGKILRINPLPGRKGQAYTVPKSNPFVKSKKYLSEIYAVGLRNPHNLCFSKEGELFVADAGRDNVEEINIIKPGANYGWSLREGPFVHLDGGGLDTGIRPLPANDQKFKFTYPNIALGHVGQKGWKFAQAKQAIAASCPIQNRSPLSGIIMFANFPSDGNLYYSMLGSARKAVTMGPPKKLKSAKIFKMQLYFNHDGNPRTPPIKVENLRDIVRFNYRGGNTDRADVRFGQGSRGEIYWSSKTNGKIYLFENTLPKN